MCNFQDFLSEQLQDTQLKQEYDALETEFSIIQASIDAQKNLLISQINSHNPLA